MTVEILVVEENPAIQDVIVLNLREAGFNVRCVGSAEQAETVLRATLPDLVILDWVLPRQSGLSLVKKIRTDQRTQGLPIVMLTALDDEDDIVRGLETGADDYITKPFSPKELVARVRAVLRRRAPHLAEDTIKLGSLVLNPVSHHVLAGGQLVKLGMTDFRILAFFMTHPDRLYSRSQLLDEIWGDRAFVNERVVDVHIRRLRSVLEASGNHNRIETVRGGGYRFRAAETRVPPAELEKFRSRMPGLPGMRKTTPATVQAFA
jgi:two-component system phosphate regulon response regulator PhoB